MGVKEFEDVLVLIRDAAAGIKELFANGKADVGDIFDLVLGLIVQIKAAVDGFDKVDEEIKDIVESEFLQLMADYGTPMLWSALSVTVFNKK